MVIIIFGVTVPLFASKSKSWNGWGHHPLWAWDFNTSQQERRGKERGERERNDSMNFIFLFLQTNFFLLFKVIKRRIFTYIYFSYYFSHIIFVHICSQDKNYLNMQLVRCWSGGVRGEPRRLTLPPKCRKY